MSRYTDTATNHLWAALKDLRAGMCELIEERDSLGAQIEACEMMDRHEAVDRALEDFERDLGAVEFNIGKVQAAILKVETAVGEITA